VSKPNPFRYFKTSPEIIRLAVMLYIRFPLSLRNVEDLLHERGIDVSHETIRFWWNRFGPMFAAEIRRKRVNQMHAYSNWQWYMFNITTIRNSKSATYRFVNSITPAFSTSGSGTARVGSSCAWQTGTSFHCVTASARERIVSYVGTDDIHVY